MITALLVSNSSSLHAYRSSSRIREMALARVEASSADIATRQALNCVNQSGCPKCMIHRLAWGLHMPNTDHARPFSIRVFVPGGNPDGLRVIEESNWTGLGVVFPRSEFPEVKSRAEFQRTGIYILVGPPDDGDLPVIYIGQGDPVRARLESHYANKDFWTWSAFFVTKDDSLNKAHIGHLESQLLALARDAKRAKLYNSNAPNPSPLSEAESARPVRG